MSRKMLFVQLDEHIVKKIFKEKGVKVLTSSDAHTADYIGYGFRELLK